MRGGALIRLPKSKAGGEGDEIDVVDEVVAVVGNEREAEAVETRAPELTA